MGKRERRRRRPGADDPSSRPQRHSAHHDPAGADAGATTDRLADALVHAVSDAYRRGWQPLDLVWALRKEPDLAELVRLAVLHEARRSAPPERWVPPRWRRQLDAIDAAAQASADPRTALARRLTEPGGRGDVALHRLARLAPLPLLEPAPASWPTSGAGPSAPTSGVPTEVLERVQALLAKAESTSFEAEAEAFTAKAQELIGRHAIDAAALALARCQHDDEPAVGRRIHVDDPYQRPKGLLLGAVAAANRCRAVIDATHGFVTVFGHPDDLDAVEVVFTSLLIQATNAMIEAGSRTDAHGRSRTRSFRTSFLTSFANRIGQRLAAVTADTVEEGTRRHGDAVLPVLAARSRASDDALAEAYPTTRSYRPSASNAEGWRSGRSAADRAELDPSRGIGGDRRRSLADGRS